MVLLCVAGDTLHFVFCVKNDEGFFFFGHLMCAREIEIGVLTVEAVAEMNRIASLRSQYISQNCFSGQFAYSSDRVPNKHKLYANKIEENPKHVSH